MTLEEAVKVEESLRELSADVEDFSWGPSWEFANQRKAEALRIIRQEIKRLKNDRSI
jgi:hypothetical protein